MKVKAKASFANLSILDVWQGSKYASGKYFKVKVNSETRGVFGTKYSRMKQDNFVEDSL